MNYKENKQLTKKYSNKVFSYVNNERKSKNYSRKDFSETWNKNVLFMDTIFEQTNFDDSRIENCRFIKCHFKNCFINKVNFISVKFEDCTFQNVVFKLCGFIDSTFEGNKKENIFFYPNSRELPKGLTVTDDVYEIGMTKELKDALNIALKNRHIRCSNTLFLKKSQHLSNAQKREMKKITPKQAKALGFGKKQRLEENAKRKEMKNKWLLQTHKDALEGKNRRLSKGSLTSLLWHFNGDKNVPKRLEYASNKIKSNFQNLSYLIKVMEGYDVNRLDS